MQEGIVTAVRVADRARLEAIVGDRNSPQKHADGEACGTSKTKIRTLRFMPTASRQSHKVLHAYLQETEVPSGNRFNHVMN